MRPIVRYMPWRFPGGPHGGREPRSVISEEGELRHWKLKIGSKSVPRPLPGSKRTRFSGWVQP